LLWAYLPAIALVVLLAFTWKAVRANEQAPPQPIRTLPAGA
jgi:hypothetical protein